MLKRPLTPDETLKISDKNHSRFTALFRPPTAFWYENWSVVAVMLEKKVAIVVKVRYRVVARSSSSAAKEGRADSGPKWYEPRVTTS